MAAGGGASGLDGRLSTPAASHLIRVKQAAGGLLLTASHNPGGPDGDFGLKFNTATGGQAPEAVTEAIYAASRTITSYRLCEFPELPLSTLGEHELGGIVLEVVDSAAGYAALMETLFDFDRMADWLRQGNRIAFDALHAVTGPYAREIFCKRLGAPDSAVLHAESLPDFGGFHPDPNPVDAAHLVELSQSPDSPALIAASDGDGDRNMILGPGMMVSPCDSIAVMLHHADKLPGYRDGVPGVARSMPTSRAVDAVATALGIPCYETPTGWRFFSNLLDAGRINLCGEESFGTSSAHTGEKDGLWAVLFWLNMMAALKMSVAEIVRDHWQHFGRTFFQRRDYFISDTSAARELLDGLEKATTNLPGNSFGNVTVTRADVISYTDPIDGSVSTHQGVRVFLEDGGRIVYRLSGTGTSGATLRVYLDKRVTDPALIEQSTDDALGDMAAAGAAIARITELTGVTEPAAIV